MKDNTIHTHVMQTTQPEVGQIWLSTPVIAKFVIMQLHQLSQVVGVGVHAVILSHPDAWRQIVVHRIDALEVPLVIADTVPLARSIAEVTAHLQRTVSAWCGTDVTIEVAVVRVAPASSAHTH